MKRHLIIFFLLCLSACSNDSYFTLSKVIDGNTVQLDNGVTVNLAGVAKNSQNIPVLEKYLSGSLVIMDTHHQTLDDFSSSHITGLIYNTDGVQINQLLIRVAHISDVPVSKPETPASGDRVVVKLVRENGVLKIPAEINGVQLYFIFDTGASLISLSSEEAERLRDQGSLDQSDFIGKSNFSDANGKVSEGVVVRLRSVKIGGRELKDVTAVITAGQNVPLLFGESAMQKFGKVSIDYSRDEITFE